MFTDVHVVDLLAAFALDSLDEEEFIQVSEHLARCAECRAELSTYQAVADQLALAVPAAIPPARVKQQLMNRVRAQAPAAAAERQPSWWQKLASLLPRSTPVWALASLLLVVVLAAANVWLWQRLERGPASAPDILPTIRLAGTQVAPDATGLLVLSEDGKHGTVVVDRLPVLSDDRQYQLWLIEDGQRTSGGVFSVNEDGYGWLWIKSPQPLSSYAGFGITIEPFGGSPGPTGDRVLASAF